MLHTTRSRPALTIAAVLSLITGLLLATPAVAAQAGPASPTSSARPADPIAHDPTIVKEGAWYYVAITGDASTPNTFLPMKRSRDLVHWEELGPVFTALPSWIVPALGVAAADAPKDLWAPDLSWSHGEWRLYYAASLFGKNQSVIGLATTRSLDPASPLYGWHDQGVVLRSTDSTKPGGDTFNAIDPNITVDRSGATWLSYGSFFSGIYLHRIDAATGKIVAGDTAVHIAERAAPDAEENSVIVFRGGYYYLFLSFDYCCRSTQSDYRTVVGRSRSITGPYLDRTGAPLLNGKGGTEVMRGYNEFAGAGGADVLLQPGQRDLVVNHYYDATDDGTPRLNVRTLSWDGSGWPHVSFPINGSRTVGHGDAYVAIVPAGARTAVANGGCGYESAPIVLGTTAGTCAEWQISDQGKGNRILNRFSNDVVENAACKNVDGGPVAQWGWLGYQQSNDCQRWIFRSAPGGSATVSSVETGHRAWTAAGGATAAGTAIELEPQAGPTGAADQRFRFVPVEPVLLGDATDHTRTLTARHGSAVDEARSARAAQVWRLVPGATAGSYRVESARGTLVATRSGLRVELRAPASATWTLVPQNDGTWAMASGSTRIAVRLLLP